MPSTGNPMNILIITQNYFPTTNKDYKVKEAIDELIKQGHKVSVVTSKGANDTLPTDSAIQFVAINQDSFNGGGEWAYVFHGISFMWKAIKLGSAIDGNFDQVIATIPTGFAGIAGKIVAGKKNAKFILDVKEPWLESAISAGYINNGSPVHKAAVMVDNWIKK